ncbi:GntR family transcriptional regulator [Acinetobacter puyangensis]|uniref:Transcriptional regulator, GntR family n=1 Tax=Acinetobacter puyangensis TaxID=1096779 RepID=A0A240EFL2_9GAMM|nr:GntR family transcriptional regulator [Acinetobacter puyangensis]SNX46755.1 transcriptional regulator, GntR family [Acinetobacter puyangensis]
MLNSTNFSQQINARYQIIFETLTKAIKDQTIPTGTVLLEAPLSKIFNTSRVPVRHALQLLSDQHLISRFDGRGYLVNPKQEYTKPIRLNITKELLGIPDNEEIIDTRLLSEKIYEELYQYISQIILHGHYRLDEQRAAEHFNISRSVVREALKNLHLQGLVEKEPYGDWLAGPLSAQSVSENYELRLILEPIALRNNIHQVSSNDLKKMSERILFAQQNIKDMDKQIIKQIEHDLHHTLCNIEWQNQKMAHIMYNAQSSILISQVLHEAIHVNDYHFMLAEHQAVIDALLYGSLESAIQNLEKHLINAKKRSVDYLKVFSIIPEPHLPPYLERVS